MLLLLGLVIEHRLGEHHVVKTTVAKVEGCSQIPQLEGHRIGHGHVSTHADILAALPRKQPCHLARVSTASVMNAPRAAERLLGSGFDLVGSLDQLGTQIVVTGGHDRGAHCGRAVVSLLGVPREP